MLDDILALDGERAGIVVAVGKGTVFRQIGHLRHIVPVVAVAARGNLVLNLLQRDLLAAAAVAVEGQTHHQLIGRYSCAEVARDALVGHEVAFPYGTPSIECRVMVGRS